MPVIPGTNPEILVLASFVHVEPDKGMNQLEPPLTLAIPTDRLSKFFATHCDGVKFPVSTTPYAALAFARGPRRMLSP
jgi:hypothetical protein